MVLISSLRMAAAVPPHVCVVGVCVDVCDSCRMVLISSLRMATPPHVCVVVDVCVCVFRVCVVLVCVCDSCRMVLTFCSRMAAPPCSPHVC